MLRVNLPLEVLHQTRTPTHVTIVVPVNFNRVRLLVLAVSAVKECMSKLPRPLLLRVLQFVQIVHLAVQQRQREVLHRRVRVQPSVKRVLLVSTTWLELVVLLLVNVLLALLVHLPWVVLQQMRILVPIALLENSNWMP